MTLVLNIVFTVFLSITLTLSCPDGFIVRKAGESSTCCKPKNCTRNEGFTLCSGSERNPGEDQCYKCPSGKYNRDPVDTSLMSANLPLCQQPDCQCSPEGVMLSNPKECNAGESLKVCECNRSAGYYGHDPHSCYKADDAVIFKSRKPGNELTEDGQVRRCKPGYFKSSPDTSVCVPHKLCLVVKVPGSPTHDNICLVMDKPPSLDVPDSHENTTFHVESNSTESKGEDQIYIYVIVAITVGILMMIIPVLFWRCGFFWYICSNNNEVNVSNQNINDERRAQVSPSTHVESNGIYDEIGLAQRLLDQTDHIRVPCDTESHQTFDIPLHQEVNPFISGQSASLDVEFSGQNSFTSLSQESEYATSSAHDNTSLKMSISRRNLDANPEQESTPCKVYPGGKVVTEVDMINRISS